MKISIIGTGYVGLVSGACLAEQGHDVVCVDNVAEKVDNINRGISPIHEEGLDALLARHVGSRLTATGAFEEAVFNSELTLIAVGTPFDGKHIDLTFIRTVAEQIAAVLKKKRDYHVVVVKSTVVPGTTDGLVRDTLERNSGKRAGADFGLGMNPEFLTEGTAVDDFMHPDRIVIGGIDTRSQDALARVYESFGDTEKIRTNNGTAEMIKYASNSLLATMISFSNEIATLCAALEDIDVVDVMKGVHASSYLTSRMPDGSAVRAGISSFLGAGCGFGGSCLPKDVKALAAQGQDLGLPMRMLDSVIEVNKGQPQHIVTLVRRHMASLENVPITVLGLSFKPDTDDVRESPAFPVIRLLAAEGAKLTAYDPVATANARKVLQDVNVAYATSLEEAIDGAEVIVIVTSWREFDRLASILSKRGNDTLVVDGRRMIDASAVPRYEGIGRTVSGHEVS